MKLRRAVATAVAAAAIAPAALFAAPAAFAAESPASASPAPSVSTTVSVAPSTSDAPTTAPSDTPSGTASSEPTAAPTGSDGPPADLFCTDQNKNYKAALQISISGLPGRITAGSGWHEFSLNLSNPSENDINNILLGAGVGPQDGQNPYSVDQVQLQGYDPDLKQWFDVSDGQYSMGILGGADLPAGDSAVAKLRLNVAKTAPLGKGLTIAFGMYPDVQNECTADASAHYNIEIVAPNKPVSGTPAPVPTPVSAPTGGNNPLPKNPPANGGTNHIIPVSDTTGSKNLAKTGASSTTPIIAGIGAAAVVLGGGAMFVVRRKKSGSAA